MGSNSTTKPSGVTHNNSVVRKRIEKLVKNCDLSNEQLTEMDPDLCKMIDLVKDSAHTRQPGDFGGEGRRQLNKLWYVLKACRSRLLAGWNMAKKTCNFRRPSKSDFLVFFFSTLATIFYFELHTNKGFTRLWLRWGDVDLRAVECTIENPNLSMELFRPPLPCSFCHHVDSIPTVTNILPKEFETLHAYNGKPVIVKNGTANWTAVKKFSFEFFKTIYKEGSRSLQHLGDDCLFFPYKTEFQSLAQVLNMSTERRKQPWYIGWSNCDSEASHILRQHYERPYFLPETAESTHADWIFMGIPGHGAHMHIDHVLNPSWQAQIVGKKRWKLQPPPECYYDCKSFEAVVFPGDIIVLDTNKWYHQTEILPGAMSITIGSEYD